MNGYLPPVPDENACHLEQQCPTKVVWQPKTTGDGPIHSARNVQDSVSEASPTVDAGTTADARKQTVTPLR